MNIDPRELKDILEMVKTIKFGCSCITLLDWDIIQEWQAELEKLCDDPHEEKTVIRRRRAGGCQIISLADRRQGRLGCEH